jgi:hypothetical protein
LGVDFLGALRLSALRVAEKLGNLGGIEENWPSVFKAACDSVGFLRGLKTPTPLRFGFSAACLATHGGLRVADLLIEARKETNVSLARTPFDASSNPLIASTWEELP